MNRLSHLTLENQVEAIAPFVVSIRVRSEAEISPPALPRNQAGNTSNGRTPDYTLAPTYGSVSLEEDFRPDPYSVRVTSGGTINLSMGLCSYGFVAEAPDFDLYYESTGRYNLYIYAVSDKDTTLLVNTPDGNWVCNDDGYNGLNPLLEFPAGPDGLYDIWVGSYDEDTAGATLYISEIDPR